MTKMTSAGLPAHEMTYRALKELLLFGEIAPGQAVTIQGLVARLGWNDACSRGAAPSDFGRCIGISEDRRVSVPVLRPKICPGEVCTRDDRT